METKHGAGGFDFVLQAYGAVAAAQGRSDLAALAQSASAQFQADQARLAAHQDYQADWAATLSKEVFAYFETDIFSTIEKLLDLV